MISPRMYESFCVPNDSRIGASFGGTAIHSCGDWARWLPTVKKFESLMVGAAFSPQTDPIQTNLKPSHALVDSALSSPRRRRYRRRFPRSDGLEAGFETVVATYVQDVKSSTSFIRIFTKSVFNPKSKLLGGDASNQ
jgi:hypothetical protein